MLFDRKRYTGTENGISLFGFLRLEELIAFPISPIDGKSTGITGTVVPGTMVCLLIARYDSNTLGFLEIEYHSKQWNTATTKKKVNDDH